MGQAGRRSGFGTALVGTLMGPIVCTSLVLTCAAAETTPSPPPRPAEAEPSGSAGVPLPPPRPRDVPPSAETAVGEPKPAPPPAPPTDPAAAEACGKRLEELGVAFEKRPDVTDEACSVREAVLVSKLPRNVAVAPASLMTCSLAEALARWTTDVVAEAARTHLDAVPTKVLIGTSYQCRNQRNGAKLSEHAFGNGVDVMGFAFEKRGTVAINFHAEGSAEAKFQDAVRQGACPLFATVLGPGSDAEHGNHLHLDQRGRKGGYRICQ